MSYDTIVIGERKVESGTGGCDRLYTGCGAPGFVLRIAGMEIFTRCLLTIYSGGVITK